MGSKVFQCWKFEYNFSISGLDIINNGDITALLSNGVPVSYIWFFIDTGVWAFDCENNPISCRPHCTGSDLLNAHTKYQQTTFRSLRLYELMVTCRYSICLLLAFTMRVPVSADLGVPVPGRMSAVAACPLSRRLLLALLQLRSCSGRQPPVRLQSAEWSCRRIQDRVLFAWMVRL